MTKYDLSDRHNMFYWQTNRNISADEQKRLFLERHSAMDKEVVIKAIEYGVNQSGVKKSESKVERLSKPINYGSVNSVYRASLASGLEVVIRIHPSEVKNGYF